MYLIEVYILFFVTFHFLYASEFLNDKLKLPQIYYDISNNIIKQVKSYSNLPYTLIQLLYLGQ